MLHENTHIYSFKALPRLYRLKVANDLLHFTSGWSFELFLNASASIKDSQAHSIHGSIGHMGELLVLSCFIPRLKCLLVIILLLGRRVDASNFDDEEDDENFRKRFFHISSASIYLFVAV